MALAGTARLTPGGPGVRMIAPLDAPQLSLFAAAEYWLRRGSVPSSEGDGVYTVAVNRVGEWGCSCPGWVSRQRSPGERPACRHIRALRSAA